MIAISMTRRLPLSVLVVCLGVLSGGCSQSAPTHVDDLAMQRLDWKSCGEYECATLLVPLDWSDPGGEQIGLQLGRIHEGTSEDTRPVLVVNPGGPGLSGLVFLEGAREVLSSGILDNFTVVSWDARGVGRSEPLACVSESELDDLRTQEFESSSDGVTAARASMQWFAQQCENDAGNLLVNIGTNANLRDLELIRQTLGQDDLNYLGFSYGSLLGLAYQEQYPDTTGRFVFDGPIDPSLSYSEMTIDQAVGFESALLSYISYCHDNPDCPLPSSDTGAVDKISDILAQATTAGIPTGTSRSLTGPLAFSAITACLYDDRLWYLLNDAISDAIEGDGAKLLTLADMAAGRDEDGTYSSNAIVASIAITCADFVMDGSEASLQEEASVLSNLAPTLGAYMGYGALKCSSWPVASDPLNISRAALSSTPLLIVATTGDPATPYEWAEHLASASDSVSLVTFEGDGHTAYGRSNSCVDGTVDDYLLYGRLPEGRVTC